MTPADVAELIAGHHRNLCALLDALDVSVDRMSAEDIGATKEFFAQCELVERALQIHIDMEDAVIVPLLRARHPQGELAALELLHHHQAQRRWLADVLGSRNAPPTAELLRSIRALVHLLRTEMDHEDTELRELARIA